MTIWWDLMPVYCELYRNWQGHPCILMSCLFPATLRLCVSHIPAPLNPLWLSFSISLLNKQRQKDYADKFNKDKLKDWVRGHRSEYARVRECMRACETVCEHVSALVCVSEGVLVYAFLICPPRTWFCIPSEFKHIFSVLPWSLWCCHLTFPTAEVPVGDQDSKLDRLKLRDLSCKNDIPLVAISLTLKAVCHLTKPFWAGAADILLQDKSSMQLPSTQQGRKNWMEIDLRGEYINKYPVVGEVFRSFI